MHACEGSKFKLKNLIIQYSSIILESIATLKDAPATTSPLTTDRKIPIVTCYSTRVLRYSN